MRIIRPYGRSATMRGSEDKAQPRRKLIRNDQLDGDAETKVEVEKFAESHMELVIAQWISVIDKIATKPSGNKEPTETQRDLRDKLGAAAWELLALRLEKIKGVDLEQAEEIWNWKLHPYKNGTNNGNRKIKAKGRWYKQFAGEAPPADINADDVAQKIEHHLYKEAMSAGGEASPKPKGAIAHRAASIAKNVLKAHQRPPLNPDWNAYFKPCDVALEIWELLEDNKKKDDKKKDNKKEDDKKKRKAPGRYLHGEVAKLLHKHYGKLFEVDDKVLGIAEAQEKLPDLFAQHEAVKDCYRALFNRRIGWDSLLQVAPRNPKELQSLAESKARNRRLADLVRLGKVLHYEDPKGETLQKPETLKHSDYYWLSDGQTEIKRNEALLRIFHETISHANLIIRDWLKDVPSESKDAPRDPIGDMEVLKKLDQHYCPDRHKKKMGVLFGKGAELFKAHQGQDILKAMIVGWMNIRHKIFHFTSLDQLKKALSENALSEQLKKALSEQLKNALSEQLKKLEPSLKKLWEDDIAAQKKRLRETLISANIEKFLSQDQAQGLWNALTENDPFSVALPRFNRVLDRAEKTKSRTYIVDLPPPARQRRLHGEKNAGRLCQYVCLKLLYERPFRAWLKENEANLKDWLDKALERTTKAAREINKTGGDLIQAKAEKLHLDATSLTAFLQDLSRHTAAEMRVQRGYESDGMAAAKQAKYIDDLLCDVLVIAFSAYLKSENLAWLTPDGGEFKGQGTCNKGQGTCNAKDLTVSGAESACEDWIPGFYFLLHATSVEAVGRLSHQLAKWDISGKKLTKKPRHEDEAFLKNLQRPLKLFLDMHDAKHEGTTGIRGGDFKTLFENTKAFDEIFPETATDDDARLPLRGLREIMRFGHQRVIEQMTTSKIPKDTVLKYKDSLTKIDGHHQEQESMHRKWSMSKNQKKWVEQHGTDYCCRMKYISEHRHRAAQVTLTDHVRAHKLLMSVLSRLADYAWLFERDLYFVTRALLHRAEKNPKKYFDDKAEKLKSGQILAVLKGCGLEKKLAEYFGSLDKCRCRRNNLAHFNLLHDDKTIDLTDYVNQTRCLMSYDRKLKNAVAKSIIELLAREGLILRWNMKEDHRLCEGCLSSRCITHLGNQKIIGESITEDLHGEAYVAMIRQLFFPQIKDRLNGKTEGTPGR